MKRIRISFFILCLLGLSHYALSQQANKPEEHRSMKATIFTTAQGTNLRLTPTGDVSFSEAIQPLESDVCVFVSTSKLYQTMLGIGGALTDASAEVFASMPLTLQDEFLKAYFDKESGIGYSLARTNIASCDFSSSSYNYVKEGDANLQTFTIQHDHQFRVPFIKRAIKQAGGSLPVLASPWSPPAFMKTNNNVLQGGKLLPQYRQSWANYYVKFITAYEKEGISIFGVSIQNEPMAKQTWESCIYTAQEECDFLKNYLGPTLQATGLGNKKIVVWDHNRDLLSQRATTIFNDPEASKYAWGIGIHWYEVWSGNGAMFDNVREVHEAFPDKNIFFTEGCVEKFDSLKLHYWPNAERYGYNMISDFCNGVMAYTDWNVLLDENGGPNHVGNFCFAPVHYNTKTGKLTYTPTFYYIGHFSRFVRPGARRISSSVSRTTLQSVSFANTDGSIVTVVMNKSDMEVSYKFFVDKSMTEMVIKPHAIQSIVYRLPQ